MSNLTTGNRGAFRKQYSRFPVPPQIITLADNTEVDATKYQVHRDFYIKQVNIGLTGSVRFGEYEEGYAVFDWTDEEVTVTFSTTFSSSPIVVINLDPYTDPLQNVKAEITAVDQTSFNLRLSAPYSGSVEYKAVYADSFPAPVVRRTLNPSLQYALVYGAVIDASSSYFSASFNLNNNVPDLGFYTPYSPTNVGMFEITTGSFIGTDFVAGDLSDSYVGQINFIVIKE